MNYEVCLALWHDALACEFGLGVTPDDGDLRGLQQAMYKAREKARDIRLQELMIFIDPDEKELWICKKQTSLSPR
jgi:hypothetical protein